MKKVLFYGLIAIVSSVSVLLVYMNSQLDYEDLLKHHTLIPEPINSQNELFVQWLGNATVVVSDGKNTIMTDAWFSRPSFSQMMSGVTTDEEAVKASLARAGIKVVDAIIPVHSHYDHAMDAPAVAELTNAVIFGSESSANVGRGWGLPEEQLLVVDKARSERFGEFTVTLLKSKHYVFVDEKFNEDAGKEITQPLKQPAAFTDYHEGGAYAVIIEHPQATILINGSTGYLDGLLNDIDADIVFLSVAGIAVQTEQYQKEYWAEVVEVVGATTVVPIHWDSMTHPLGDEPQGPSRLMDSILLNVRMKESVYWLIDKGGATNAGAINAGDMNSTKGKAEEYYTPLMPLWEKVPLSQLVREER
ncbi:MAG: MBL fold metallo-hydrolase [Agarilytica sp.]